MNELANAHAGLVRKETIGNVVASAVIAALLSWLILHRQADIDLHAPPPGGIFGIVPGTFNFTLLVTFALTLITRRRVRTGQHARRTARVPRADWLPGNVLVRSLLLAVCATITLVPLTYALVWGAVSAGLAPPHWSFGAVLAFYVAYFVVLTVIVTPLVVWRALRD